MALGPHDHAVIADRIARFATIANVPVGALLAIRFWDALGLMQHAPWLPPLTLIAGSVIWSVSLVTGQVALWLHERRAAWAVGASRRQVWTRRASAGLVFGSLTDTSPLFDFT